MVLFQQVDFFMNENFRILLIVNEFDDSTHIFYYMLLFQSTERAAKFVNEHQKLIKFLFGGILIGIPAILVLLLMVKVWATVVVHSRHNKNRSSGTHCVVFKVKVISKVNVECQFATEYATLLKSGMH